MTFRTLVLRSASYHWRTNLAVILGVAAASSVLGGALVVGDSVRGSLREIAVGRLGRAEIVISSTGFFREDISASVTGSLSGASASPMIVASGFVTHEPSGRRAAGVLVYGVDERFWDFHGRHPVEGVRASPALAAELGASDGDVLLTRLQKPSAVPIESLFGRKDDVARTVRLTLGAVLPREQLGEFALKPQQSEVRAVFAPLRRIQRDLGVTGQVNTVLIAGVPPSELDRLRSALTLEDLGVTVRVIEAPPDVSATPWLAVESPTGILNDGVDEAARRAGKKLGLEPLPIFTYLANSIRKGDRQIPYSLITATDLKALPIPVLPGLAGSTLKSRVAAPSARPSPASDPPIVLNQWAARELSAAVGDRVEIDYYLWDAAAGLETRTGAFTVASVVPITGLAADRHLAPEYPGITAAASLADWDPPFPIDLSRVRPIDEKYWDEYRTTPKAFIAYEKGRELWRTRYGAATAIRFEPTLTGAHSVAEALRRELRASIDPASTGVSVVAARQAALDASTGATDFGEYFIYFSFFLVSSALLLAVLFFKLGVEQRLKQIGIMRAAGYSIGRIRGLLLTEACALAVAGSVLGTLGAVAYGRLVVFLLETWWSGAVGTTLLDLHVSPVSLAVGAVAGVLAAVLCVAWSLRAVSRMSPRALLSAQSIDVPASADPRRARRSSRIAAVCTVAGFALIAGGFLRREAQTAAFFGAGSALLAGSLFWLSAWLRAHDPRPIAGRGVWAIARLGFRSAAFRPARSVLSAALIASASFIIVSVDAFRRDGGEIVGPRDSGTGGYVLLAQSEVPLVHNPNDAAGREALLIQAPEMANVRFTRFRVRPGEDASCLNLYRPTNPTIVAPEAGFIESGRFSFTASLAENDQERANPWLLLRRQFADGAIPVVADATSLQYVLHAAVGDDFRLDTGGAQPITLRFVAALRDSVLQGELVMGEEQFVRLFPRQQGYRFFLIDAPDVRNADDATKLAGVVERELSPAGVDAVTAAERLAAFHRVENTYLSTFQALGGLGLLLGTLGLATVMFRNVLERRRELALLRAVGYDSRRVSLLIVAEVALLLGAGLAAGAGCAALAIAPAWIGHAGSLPGIGLAALLAAVIAAGFLSAFAAARAAVRGRMLEALRAD